MPKHDSTELELSAEELKNKWLRAMADLENLRKRTARDIEEARGQGEARAAEAFLPIIDDFRRLMAAVANDQGVMSESAIVRALELLFRKFDQQLTQIGIEGFESEGRKFTYELMEAICEAPTKEHEPGTVVSEISRGYTHRHKLLRPAQVTVAVPLKEDE